MSGKCKYIQLPLQFCQKYVPSNTLNTFSALTTQNPQENSTNGYDIVNPTKPQVLNWKPTTEGTVSLVLYRAPAPGEHYEDRDNLSVGLLDKQDVIPNIENTGTYTWTPYQMSYDPLDSDDDLRSRRVFTFSIVPDGDPAKTNFWPPFAIGGTRTNELQANDTTKPTSTSRILPDIQASTATLSPTDIPSAIVTDSTPFATSAVRHISLDSTTTTPTLLGTTVIHTPTTRTPSLPSPNSNTASSKIPRNVSPSVVAAIALGAVTIVLLSLFIGVLACNRRRKREALHELPVEDEYYHSHTRNQYWEKRSTADSTHEKWRREKERERMREKELERVELESGWGPPEMEGRRLHPRRDRGTFYKSPRVSVPPKSRVVSYYL